MPRTKGSSHNVCIRELLQAIDMHGKTDRHMKLLTIQKESRRKEAGGRKRFWRRRLDGIGLDTVNKVFLAIEFKRMQEKLG